MKCLSSLTLAVLLSTSDVVPTITHAFVVPETPEKNCELAPDGAKPQNSETSISAIVTGIDREQGVVNLETEVARAQITVLPEALQGLHVGDQVELCMIDEDPSQNLLQDSILT